MYGLAVALVAPENAAELIESAGAAVGLGEFRMDVDAGGGYCGCVSWAAAGFVEQLDASGLQQVGLRWVAEAIGDDPAAAAQMAWQRAVALVSASAKHDSAGAD